MRPKLFIGSSREGLEIAYAIQSNLMREAECTIWNQGIFGISENVLVSLMKALNENEFGVFVLSPDDTVLIRGAKSVAARDNVIFELGLFIGRLGPGRSFFLIPSDEEDLRLPTDLLGITPGIYEGSRRDGNWMAALGPACWQIKQQMSKPDDPANGSSKNKNVPILEIPSGMSPPKTEPAFKGISLSKRGSGYLITGNTKPCKETLKTVGAIWNPKLGGWIVALGRMPDLMRQLVQILDESENKQNPD